MWGRWLLSGLVVAGAIAGSVEQASGPAEILACGAGSYENVDGLCISGPSRAVCLPEVPCSSAEGRRWGRLRYVGTATTRSVHTIPGLAQATVAYRSG
jgi:hypothetical protein